MINYNRNTKRICIYGIGGVGGYFGGKMALKASQDKNINVDIYFIARGKQLEEIKNNGLVLNSIEQGKVICKPKLAAEKIGEIPNPDLILLCIKSYDLEKVLYEISGSINEDTVLIPLLNGVNIYQRVRKVIDKGIVLPACVYVAAHIEKPGVVTFSGNGGLIVLGKDPQNPDYLQQNLLNQFEQMSIDYKWFEDPFPAIWKKYLFVASFALVTACYEKTFREVAADNETRRQVSEIMNEIKSIAIREGVVLHKDIIESALAKAEGLSIEVKSSFQRDVEQNGLKNEGDIFGETIIKMGEKHGIPTSVTSKTYSCIKKKLAVQDIDL